MSAVHDPQDKGGGWFAAAWSWADGAGRIAGIAFLVGLVHQIFGSIHAPQDYFSLRGMPWNDALAYHLAARDLLDGLGLRENHSFPMLHQAVRAPGYILWVAVVYSWGLGRLGLTLLQLALHAVTCGLTLFIGARAFGRRAGQFAGLALALSGIHIDYAALVMTETVSTACTVLGVWLVVRERPRLLWAALSVGIAATMRPTALPLGILLPAYALWQRRVSWQRLLMAVALCLAPAVLVAARNHHVMGRFSPASTYHVWTTWSEIVPTAPDSNDRNYAAFVPLRAQTEAEQQRHFQAEFLRFVRDQPLRTLRRAYHLFISNLRLPLEQPLELSGLLLLPLLLVAGWGCTRGRNRPLIELLAVWVLVFLGTTALLGESSGRFRMPVEWALLILGAGGLSAALGIEGAPVVPSEPGAPGRFRRWTSIVGLALGALGILVPVARMLTAREPERIAFDPQTLGAHPLPFDQYVQALFSDPSSVEGSIVAWPGIVDALVHLGPSRSDPRSDILSSRPYGRTIATFQVDGKLGPRDGRRIFLEIPDSLGWPVPERSRAVVIGRIETNLNSPTRERARLVATGIRPL